MHIYRTQQFHRLLLILLFVFCVLKILFTGYDIDEQYAVSMPYRMLKGDFPLSDMWEPHQTSGFLAALFMLPYLSVTGSATGIVLYLRICGLLCHIGVTYLLYKALCRYLNQSYSLLICGIFFLSLPKFMLLPEFSNMQVWFLMLCILCMIKYYETNTLIHLIGAGFFLSLEVLTYPSTIFTFFACLFCIIHYHYKQCPTLLSSQKHSLLTELACFILPCIFCAMVFFALLLSHMSLSSLWEQLLIIADDGSHSASLGERFAAHMQSFLEILLLLGSYSILAALLYFILRKCRICQGIPFLWCRLLIVCSLLGQLFIWLFGNQYPGYPMLEYLLLPLLTVIIFIRKRVRSAPVFTLFIIIPPAAFLGILLLSNHPLMVSLPYLAPCAVGALALIELMQCLGSTAKRSGFLPRLLSHRGIVLLWLLVLLFGRCYMLRTTGGIHYTITDEISLMREGPALGILADTESVRHYRVSYQFMEENLPEGARVFYAGSSSLLYLMKDMEICTPSTISTPTFNDTITAYFDSHPDKQPEYLVLETELMDLYDANKWLSGFIQKYCSETPIAANDFLLIYTISYNT